MQLRKDQQRRTPQRTPHSERNSCYSKWRQSKRRKHLRNVFDKPPPLYNSSPTGGGGGRQQGGWTTPLAAKIGHRWEYTAILSCFWPFGHFWPFFWPLLATLGHFGPFLTIFDNFGHFLPTLNNFLPFVIIALKINFNYSGTILWSYWSFSMPFWGISSQFYGIYPSKLQKKLL